MDFQWRFEAFDAGEPRQPGPRRPSPTGPWWLLVAVLATALAVLGWSLIRDARARSDAELTIELQRILNLEQQAVNGGDGELFLSLQTEDPAWISSQFLTHNQTFHRAERRITRAVLARDEAWANVSWRQGNDDWQRVVFFENIEGEWRRSGGSDQFWGTPGRYRYDWGVVSATEADEELLPAIDLFMQRIPCCQTGPLEVSLSTTDTAPYRLGDAVVVPSPRLVGLNEAGMPGTPFWRLLASVTERTDEPLSFVVPDFWQPRYKALAADFAEVSGVEVEIVPRSTLPEDPALWLPEVDGAFLIPTVGLITGGFVADLTDFSQLDLSFAADDFFGQIWPAAWWQDRLWLVPAAAYLPIIYYDRAAYSAAGVSELGIGSTWDDLSAAVAQLNNNDPLREPYYGLVDTELYTLWGVALNDETGCPDGPCVLPVTASDLMRAASWYEEVAAGRMPDLVGLDAATRAHIGLQTGSGRESATWVGHPVEYEENLMLLNLGLAPFPVSVAAATEALSPGAGVTPLRVYGHVMSGTTTRPDLVWSWLRFLSFQVTVDRIRDVPARPSTAATSSYWARLPGPLASVMREAFPIARPIRLDEAEWITWDRLAPPDPVLAPHTAWFTRQPQQQD